MREKSPPKGISARGIARATGHSAVAVYYRLKKMKISPLIVSESGQSLYDASVVETLRQVMRKPRAEALK